MDFAIAEVNDISRYLCDQVDEIGIPMLPGCYMEISSDSIPGLQSVTL